MLPYGEFDRAVPREKQKLRVDARDKKYVRGLFPFVLAEALPGEFVRRIAASDEDWDAFGADYVETLVRLRLEAAKILFVAELPAAPRPGLFPAGWGGGG